MSQHLHHADCGCTARLSRRGVLGFGVAGAALAAFPVLADVSYEAMLVNCIDPRVATASWAYMAGQGYKDLYSHFVVAGGPIGIVAPNFPEWKRTFFQNLGISVEHHHIRHVVALTHRDCAAGAVVFGAKFKTDKGFETTSHATALRQFRAEVTKVQPRLAVHLGVMALDGSVEAVA